MCVCVCIHADVAGSCVFRAMHVEERFDRTGMPAGIASQEHKQASVYRDVKA